MIIHRMEQGSPEWFDLRLGKVTGSRVDKVFKATNLDLIDELIAETETGLSDDNGYVSEAMQRGKDLESIALQEYSKIPYPNAQISIESVGFIQSERWPLLGMSPDGLIDGGNGVVETKCPASKNHIKYIRMGLVPAEYRWQVYSPFLISDDIGFVDFVSFDPRVSRKPIWIKRTLRSEIEKELSEAAEQLDKFFAKLEKYRNELMF